MKPIIIKMKDLSESTEIYEKKPNPAIVGFIYILLAILLIGIPWMACSKTDIVTEANGIIFYTSDVSYVTSNHEARIVKRNVTDGQYVTEGTVLFELKSLAGKTDTKDDKDDGDTENEDILNGQPVIRAKENGYFFGTNEAEEGSILQIGSNVGYLFQKPQKTFQAQVVVNANDIGGIREGQQVRVEVEAFPASEYGTITGRIAKIMDEAQYDQQTETSYFPVWIDFDATSLVDKKNDEVPLRSGLFCRAKIVTGRKRVLTYVWDYIR